MTAAPARCQWFLSCDRPAQTTEIHPTLGEVPICWRCASRVARLALARAA